LRYLRLRFERSLRGSSCLVGIPQEWSESQPEQRYPAPRLGEHTLQLLTEYGLAPDEARQIVASGDALQAPEIPAEK